MILRRMNQADSRPPLSNPQAARTVFLESQRQAEPPFAIILQPEHAKLAGDLAGALRDDVFGLLGSDALRAAAEHDLGWQTSDSAQMAAIGRRRPKPFPDVSAEESIQAGRNSIVKAASVSPLMEVLVSRHFTTLGSGDPTREVFVREETERRTPIERRLPVAPGDLDRCTAALGFCDLLSLYLCCGSEEAAEFPLAHPADPAAEFAKKVTLSWADGQPGFSSPVLQASAHFGLHARIYTDDSGDLRPFTLEWTFRQ